VSLGKEGGMGGEACNWLCDISEGGESEDVSVAGNEIVCDKADDI
jgi:hypothetical protein